MADVNNNTTASECSTGGTLESGLHSIQQGTPSTLSSIQEVYGALLDALWKDQDRVLSATATKVIIGRQKEYLHALQLTSKFIIGILNLLVGGPSSELPPQPVPAIQRGLRNSNSADTNFHRRQLLEQTVTRSDLLLKVLEENFPDDQEIQDGVLGRSREDIVVVPYKEHPGLYSFTFADDDEEDSENLLSIDRRALEQEEQDLLRMAYTPVPGEDSNGNPPDPQPLFESSLENQLQAEWTMQVYNECQERRKRQKLSTK